MHYSFFIEDVKATRIHLGFLSEFSEPRRLQLSPILRLRKWMLDIALSNDLSSNDTFQGMLTLHRYRVLLKIWNLHVNSNHNISHDTLSLRTNNYSIYPGGLNDTFIYEQSACSEYDTFSTTTFSPAMSTDSTLTVESPGMTEMFLDMECYCG